MFNSTHVSYFTLVAYFDTGLLKYLYFTVVLCLYVLIVVSNVLLVVIICVNRRLHEPMYMFLCSLFVNELYGSTGLFPSLLVHILSRVHTVSASLCFLQIYCVYSYACVEVLNLAVMSYDRFLAICFPLQYHTRMTRSKVFLLIAVTWLCPLLGMVVILSLTVPLQLCGNAIDKLFCANYAVVKLACSDTSVNNVYGLVYTFLSIFLPSILIVYSYARILKVCFSASKATRHKAVSTCTPHLASLLNFAFGCCFQILEGRFNFSSLPRVLNIILSIYFLTCQPLFTPLLYGLKLSKVRVACRRTLCPS